MDYLRHTNIQRTIHFNCMGGQIYFRPYRITHRLYAIIRHAEQQAISQRYNNNTNNTTTSNVATKKIKNEIMIGHSVVTEEHIPHCVHTDTHPIMLKVQRETKRRNNGTRPFSLSEISDKTSKMLREDQMYISGILLIRLILSVMG